MGGFDHLRHFESGIPWHRMAPEVGKSAGIFVVHRETAGKLIRLRAAFAAALNAAVATDRHDAAFFPPEHAPR